MIDGRDIGDNQPSKSTPRKMKDDQTDFTILPTIDNDQGSKKNAKEEEAWSESDAETKEAEPHTG